MLAEYGGPATLSKGWAKSVLKRMNFTRRVGTTQAKITLQQFVEKRMEFLQNIIDVVKMEDIPAELIFNWDQTGLYLVQHLVGLWPPKTDKNKRFKG